MKKTIAIFVAVCLTLALAAPAAWAGPKQRHRWEGVAIGMGAAILGGALINAHRYPPACNRGGSTVIIRGETRIDPPPRYPVRRHDRRGHWETRRVWVSPAYERVWNPGHYDRGHRWVPGGWIEVVKEPGYWKEERIWVSNR